ncbi:penicillin-binding protein 1C [Pseudaestuariivita sp.]|uniref:penicillin-binding protein 1C n=1 Tax=Pseudaestuariivita sp. TaxID=2211669 RepID=UPI0040586E5D
MRWAFACVLIAWSLAAALDAARDWVARTELPDLLTETSVEVLDRGGTLLRAYPVEDGRWRLDVGLRDVDPGYIALLLRYEDKRFRSHAGVDLQAMARAVWQSLSAGRVVSGGSTLTMQVARLLENSGTGRLAGKLRQVRLALALEQRLSKDEILTLYLLHAPFGGNLEGVRAATLAYFGKEPGRLTPAEAALLVALPQAPEARRPDVYPERARAARDRVLARMAEARVLEREDVVAARHAPLPEARRALPQDAPHLADRAVSDAPLAQTHHLTLDGQLQRALTRLARDVAEEAGRGLAVAIVAADHQTGEVRASVGASVYGNAQPGGFLDLTRAARSPGSTLKPFVYGLAFDRGMLHPETLIDDRPVDFDGYAPQNFDGVFRGQLPVADALRLSLNTPVVQVAEALGPAHLMSFLERSGAEPRLPSGQAGLAVVLGGVGLSLHDLTRAYGTLARGGKAVPWHWCQGAEVKPEARLMTRRSAWQVAHILAETPPPTGARPLRIAYKTGTSYGHRDTWAVGFDGRHVVGVWIGRPDGTAVPGVFGAELAAPVVFAAFEQISTEITPLPPPPPETLLVGHDRLPDHLKRFGRAAVDSAAPRLAFPPDGAQVALREGVLTVKVRGGAAPYVWLAEGAVASTRTEAREHDLTGLGPGWTTLAVVDAAGRAARVEVEILP